jgi:multisubunit Na+/H+ antiporter MnhB subunit
MKRVFTLPCRHLIQKIATPYYSKLEHVDVVFVDVVNVNVVFKVVILL